MTPAKPLVRRTSSVWLRALALVSLLLPSTGANGFNLNPKATKGLSQTYGFLVGQELSLQRVAQDVPELAGEVELARRQFNSTFPQSLPKVEAMFRRALNEKDFGKNKAMLEAFIRESLGSARLTRSQGQQFLRQVIQRSMADIDSPVLEYLLAVQYADYPVGEFTDGFRQRYETTGQGKAQGIRLRLQLPRSWAGKDGERPHIVQKWQSENGTGQEMIVLTVGDPQELNPTREELADFIRSREVRAAVPEGATYVDAGIFTIEQRPGYWIRMTMRQERAGLSMSQEVQQYQFFYQGKPVMLSCSAVAVQQDAEAATDAMKRLLPLCQQVLNSLVLLQVY